MLFVYVNFLVSSWMLLSTIILLVTESTKLFDENALILTIIGADILMTKLRRDAIKANAIKKD